MERLLYIIMKSIIGIIAILLTYINASAQKADGTEPTKETTTVLKVDSTEREKIEQWTLQNTFPDIIVFIKDSLGNYIVGKEVLSDPVYLKTGVFEGAKQETLKDFLLQKSDTIEYTPRKEEEPKAKRN